jgi:hypothetical protein
MYVGYKQLVCLIKLEQNMKGGHRMCDFASSRKDESSRFIGGFQMYVPPRPLKKLWEKVKIWKDNYIQQEL